MSTPSRHSRLHMRQFYNPTQKGSEIKMETGLQRLRRELAEKEKRQQQQEEQVRRSQHAQNATPMGR